MNRTKKLFSYIQIQPYGEYILFFYTVTIQKLSKVKIQQCWLSKLLVSNPYKV